MSSRRIAVCLVALVASVLVAVPSPAQAARTGELTVHFEGVFGGPVQLTPWLTLYQAFGQLRFEGVFEDLLPGLDAIDPDLSVAGAGGTTVEPSGQILSVRVDLGGILADLLVGCTFQVDTLGGPCQALGGLRGDGTLTIDVFELREDGSFVFHIRFPSVVCPRCPAR